MSASGTSGGLSSDEEPLDDALVAQYAHDHRPLGSRFQDTCRQTRSLGGLPESEGIPSGVTHDLVLKFDLPARKAEREERLLSMWGGDVDQTLFEICVKGARGGKDVLFLLAHGADGNRVGEHGWPVLWHAAHNGHLTVVEALVDAGAGELGGALCQSAKKGRVAVARLLLDRGADVHHGSDQAVFSAAAEDHLDMVQFLLQRGATARKIARYHAEQKGHFAVANLLRAHGSN